MVRFLFRGALWVLVTAALVLFIAGLSIAPHRPVSFLVDARSEIVSFTVPVESGFLPVEIQGGALCLQGNGGASSGAAESPCPRDRLAIENASGDLGLPPGSEVTVTRVGRAAFQMVIVPDRNDLASSCEETGKVIFQSATPSPNPVELWCDTVLFVMTDVSASTAPWIAIDNARQFTLGHYLNAGAASGSPTVLDGKITMRGQSLFRDLFQQIRGERAALTDLRWIADFGEVPIVKTEKITFCCEGKDGRAPTAVLRIRAGDEGLDVVARSLANGVRAGAAGGVTRIVAPTTFDRFKDPATAWIGGLIALLSLFPIVLVRRG